MQKANFATYIGVLAALFLVVCCPTEAVAQAPAQPGVNKRFKVEGGVIREIVQETAPDSLRRDSLQLALDSVHRDSLLAAAGAMRQEADSLLAVDTLQRDPSLIAADAMRRDSLLRLADSLQRGADSLYMLRAKQLAYPATSTNLKAVDNTGVDTIIAKRTRRRDRDAADTVRYSRLFRDTIQLSPLIAISMVVPGFAQLYNNQWWKIPILYGTTGTLAYAGFQQNKKFKEYRTEYDAWKSQQAPRDNTIDSIQRKMIQHNTARTLLFAGAIASYVYFLGDGAINYNGSTTHVKRATTLSMICPGAGQIYNRSYWKAPIVVGAFATMAYVIDWNSRGYNRFRRAYNALTDDDPNTIDEFNGSLSAESLKTWKNSYRRNRDLCIIIAAGLYILNIVDAHVDAHLRDFDVGDDLSWSVEPAIMPFYAQNNRASNAMGLSFKLKF